MTVFGHPLASIWPAIVLALMAAPVEARATAIQAPPKLKGECHWVHGRFAVYNGASVQRIWIIGTKRLVAIPDDDPAIPEVIRSYENLGPFDRFEDALFADFRICALEDNKPGHMQLVRVTDVRNPIFRGRPFVAASARQRRAP